MKSHIFVLLCTLCVVGVCDTDIKLSNSSTEHQHTDIVLIGATGDLSKKYLWQGFFDLFYKYSDNKTTFRFYGCGRSDKVEGENLLADIINTRTKCQDEKDEICLKKRKLFKSSVSYYPLKDELDFITFADTLDTGGHQDAPLLGRVIYMSIPPKSYTYMAAKMRETTYLTGKHHWNRLVLEKPFGSDKSSAIEMAESVTKSYKEEEIYRVDHYLGKSVVKQILAFR